MKINFVVEIASGDKRCAIAYQVSEYSNLYHYFDCVFAGRDVEVVCVTYVSSKKLAEITAKAWNENYKNQNKLLEEW